MLMGQGYICDSFTQWRICNFWLLVFQWILWLQHWLLKHMMQKNWWKNIHLPEASWASVGVSRLSLNCVVDNTGLPTDNPHTGLKGGKGCGPRTYLLTMGPHGTSLGLAPAHTALINPSLSHRGPAAVVVWIHECLWLIIPEIWAHDADVRIQ